MRSILLLGGMLVFWSEASQHIVRPVSACARFERVYGGISDTPFMRGLRVCDALRSGHYESARQLLLLSWRIHWRIDLACKDYKGHAALWYAVAAQQYAIIRLLLRLGADPLADSALFLALVRNDLRVLQIFLEVHPELLYGLQFYNVRTLLGEALLLTCKPVVQFLLYRGADLGCVDNEGHSAAAFLRMRIAALHASRTLTSPIQQQMIDQHKELLVLLDVWTPADTLSELSDDEEAMPGCPVAKASFVSDPYPPELVEEIAYEMKTPLRYASLVCLGKPVCPVRGTVIGGVPLPVGPALCEAVMQGNFTRVWDLLEQGAHPWTQYYGGDVPERVYDLARHLYHAQPAVAEWRIIYYACKKALEEGGGARPGFSARMAARLTASVQSGGQVR